MADTSLQPDQADDLDLLTKIGIDGIPLNADVLTLRQAWPWVYHHLHVAYRAGRETGAD